MSGYIDKSIEPVIAIGHTRVAKVLAGLWLIGGILAIALIGLLYREHFGLAVGVWFMGPIGVAEAVIISRLGYLLIRDGIRGESPEASR